jgi:virginiamycin B lyase
MAALAIGLAIAPAASPEAPLPAHRFSPDTTAPASAWLALLPSGEEKRRFIVDCAGCHTFDAQIAREGPAPRTRGAWEASVQKMLSFAGASTGFPIMSPDRDPVRTAEWLERHLTDRVPGTVESPGSQGASGYEVIEYPLPKPDLPHDLAIASDGRIVVTGMVSHVLYVFDPATGTFEEKPIPVPDANPRAIEIGPDGVWWIVLGDPGLIARYDPARGEWRDWDVGVYAHELAIDSAGRVWYNGHFTKAPEILGMIDPSDGTIRTFEVPSPPLANGGSTIPYGLRAGPDGTIWMTELLGNRLVRFDPGSERFVIHDLPTPHSGPRRLDVDAHGIVWIPEFANDRLARFDPATGDFTEHVVPTADALPYVARVDPRSGAVWLGTAAGDLVARFDPASGAFVEIPLPTGSALVRHLAIDPRTGDVWGATSPFPIVSPRLFVVRPRG